MTRSEKVFKSICHLLVATFVFEQTAYADPASLKTLTLPPAAPQIQLPESVGRVESRAPGDSGYTVYYIQDAHTNDSAQLNIARVIERLAAQGVKTIFLEAGTGDDSLHDLRALAPADRRRSAARGLVLSGELSGAEYFDLTTDGPTRLWGVEDRALYERSLKAYSAVASRREAVLGELERASRSVQSLKADVFSSVLMDWDKHRSSWRQGRQSLTAYFEALQSIAERGGIHLRYYPELYRLRGIMDLEKSVDFKKASQEQLRALEALSAEERQALADDALSVDDLSGSSRRADAVLSLLAEKHGGLGRFAALERYHAYVRAARSLSSERALDELHLLERELERKLVRTPDEAALLRADRFLELAKGLVRLTLTPDDFAQFRREKTSGDLPELLGWLNRQVVEQDREYHRILFWEESTRDFLDAAEAFYELTLERDRAFVRNILSEMKKSGENRAVLVAGGYHGPNLRRLFSEEGVAYASIQPQVAKETNLKRYEKILFERAHGRPAAEPSGSASQIAVVPVRQSTAAFEKTAAWVRQFGAAATPVSPAVSSSSTTLAGSIKSWFSGTRPGSVIARPEGANQPMRPSAEMASSFAVPTPLNDALNSGARLAKNVPARQTQTNELYQITAKNLTADDAVQALREAMYDLYAQTGIVESYMSGQGPGKVPSVPIKARIEFLAGTHQEFSTDMKRASSAAAGDVGHVTVIRDLKNQVERALGEGRRVDVTLTISAAGVTFLFKERDGRGARLATEAEVEKGRKYWAQESKTTPTPAGYQPATDQDIPDIAKSFSSEELIAFERRAAASINRGEGYFASLIAGASSRMNTADLPANVRSILDGKEVKSKAAVPIGEWNGRPVTYLGEDHENLARLFRLIENEARSAGAPSRVWSNTLGHMSNDEYRPEHDQMLMDNQNFGLKADQIRFFHQPLGPVYYARPEAVRALGPSKFASQEAYEEALRLSERAEEAFRAGRFDELIIPGEMQAQGHGEFFHQFIVSGELLEMIDSGKQWGFVRNIDNVAAKYDKVFLRLLGYFLQSGTDFMMEGAPNFPAHKGGKIYKDPAGNLKADEDPNAKAAGLDTQKAARVNNAVAFFRPRYLIGLYRLPGQTDEQFIAELRAASAEQREAIAQRGRVKFPVIWDTKPSTTTPAAYAKGETNMWQSSMVQAPDIRITAIGVGGSRDFPIDAFLSSMTPSQRDEALAYLRFIATKNWTKSPSEVEAARKGMPGASENQVGIALETYVGNAPLYPYFIRYSREAELITPGLLSGRPATFAEAAQQAEADLLSDSDRVTVNFFFNNQFVRVLSLDKGQALTQLREALDSKGVSVSDGNVYRATADKGGSGYPSFLSIVEGGPQGARLAGAYDSYYAEFNRLSEERDVLRRSRDYIFINGEGQGTEVETWKSRVATNSSDLRALATSIYMDTNQSAQPGWEEVEGLASRASELANDDLSNLAGARLAERPLTDEEIRDAMGDRARHWVYLSDEAFLPERTDLSTRDLMAALLAGAVRGVAVGDTFQFVANEGFQAWFQQQPKDGARLAAETERMAGAVRDAENRLALTLGVLAASDVAFGAEIRRHLDDLKDQPRFQANQGRGNVAGDYSYRVEGFLQEAERSLTALAGQAQPVLSGGLGLPSGHRAVFSPAKTVAQPIFDRVRALEKALAFIDDPSYRRTVMDELLQTAGLDDAAPAGTSVVIKHTNEPAGLSLADQWWQGRRDDVFSAQRSETDLYAVLARPRAAAQLRQFLLSWIDEKYAGAVTAIETKTARTERGPGEVWVHVNNGPAAVVETGIKPPQVEPEPVRIQTPADAILGRIAQSELSLDEALQVLTKTQSYFQRLSVVQSRGWGVEELPAATGSQFQADFQAYLMTQINNLPPSDSLTTVGEAIRRLTAFQVSVERMAADIALLPGGGRIEVAGISRDRAVELAQDWVSNSTGNYIELKFGTTSRFVPITGQGPNNHPDSGFIGNFKNWLRRHFLDQELTWRIEGGEIHKVMKLEIGPGARLALRDELIATIKDFAGDYPGYSLAVSLDGIPINPRVDGQAVPLTAANIGIALSTFLTPGGLYSYTANIGRDEGKIEFSLTTTSGARLSLLSPAQLLVREDVPASPISLGLSDAELNRRILFRLLSVDESEFGRVLRAGSIVPYQTPAATAFLSVQIEGRGAELRVSGIDEPVARIDDLKAYAEGLGQSLNQEGQRPSVAIKNQAAELVQLARFQNTSVETVFRSAVRARDAAEPAKPFSIQKGPKALVIALEPLLNISVNMADLGQVGVYEARLQNMFAALVEFAKSPMVGQTRDGQEPLQIYLSGLGQASPEKSMMIQAEMAKWQKLYPHLEFGAGEGVEGVVGRAVDRLTKANRVRDGKSIHLSAASDAQLDTFEGWGAFLRALYAAASDYTALYRAETGQIDFASHDAGTESFGLIYSVVKSRLTADSKLSSAEELAQAFEGGDALFGFSWDLALASRVKWDVIVAGARMALEAVGGSA